MVTVSPISTSAGAIDRSLTTKAAGAGGGGTGGGTARTAKGVKWSIGAQMVFVIGSTTPPSSTSHSPATSSHTARTRSSSATSAGIRDSS